MIWVFMVAVPAAVTSLLCVALLQNDVCCAVGWTSHAFLGVQVAVFVGLLVPGKKCAFARSDSVRIYFTATHMLLA